MAGEWKSARISEVVDVTDYVANGSFESIRNGVTYQSKPDYAVLVRLVDHRAGWVGDFVYVDEASYNFLRKSSLIPGDIIIANVGANAGTAFRVPDLDMPMTLGPNAILCRPKNEHVLTRDFLYYYLISDVGKRSLHSILSGSAQPKFNKTDFRLLFVPVPPTSEQAVIAGILGTLDDKIELNRRVSETLEAMTRALFKSWFVDFDPVRAKVEGRPRGLPPDLDALFPESLEESELGEVPRGWTPTLLGDLVDVVKGRSYKSEELAPSDTALVTLKSFARGGGYRADGLKPFTGTYRPEQVIEPGEIVVACTDLTQAAEVIGRTARVQRSRLYRTLVGSLDTLVLRSRNGLSREFLYFLGQSERFVAHTFAHTSGTTVLHLSSNAVPSFTLPAPPSGLVAEFGAIAGPCLERVSSCAAESETLVDLRDALLPRLVSGEIRLQKPAAIAAYAV